MLYRACTLFPLPFSRHCITFLQLKLQPPSGGHWASSSGPIRAIGVSSKAPSLSWRERSLLHSLFPVALPVIGKHFLTSRLLQSSVHDCIHGLVSGEKKKSSIFKHGLRSLDAQLTLHVKPQEVWDWPKAFQNGSTWAHWQRGHSLGWPDHQNLTRRLISPLIESLWPPDVFEEFSRLLIPLHKGGGKSNCEIASLPRNPALYCIGYCI